MPGCMLMRGRALSLLRKPTLARDLIKETLAGRAHHEVAL
jgi:hypothetical protein